jgi:hypothetical protein|tara:strand:- start:797 stop:928 length:132 start_codon:yes stop_codon:yes gene_type:complete
VPYALNLLASNAASGLALVSSVMYLDGDDVLRVVPYKKCSSVS